MDGSADVEANMPRGSTPEPVPPAARIAAAGPDGGPSVGIPVVFKNLSYTVTSSREGGKGVQILRGITGCFSPGEMSALMGASGSGKTTLLDAISGRKTKGELGGEVAFAGQKPSRAFLRRHTGYVEQFDTLIGVLTVREMLLYTAEMKRPVAEPLEEKRRIVDHYIDVLGLTECKDKRIGNRLNRGISGGQAKRANVGLAMVVNPKVLFLDEPTSGLDSYMAKEVMRAVRDVAERGVTVCATIHAPSAFVFGLFDRLLVLARGQVAYHGPNGAEMVHYFRHGCGLVPPESLLTRHKLDGGGSSSIGGGGSSSNMAEFLTDIVVGADRDMRSDEYVEAYEASAMRARMEAIVDENSTELAAKDTGQGRTEPSAGGSAAVTPLWKGVATIVKYRTVRNHCDPEFLLQRFSDKIVFSILMATLYRGVGSDLVPSNYINIASVLYMWSVMPAFTASSFVPEIFFERPLYVRERNDGLYRPITYLVAKLIDELFLLIVSSLLFSAFVFFVIDLHGSFAIFWLTYLITLSIGVALGYLVAALCPTMDVANAALPAYVAALLFFMGFMLRFENMPAYWKWVSYLNFLRYCWGAHMINTFKDVREADGAVPMLGGEPVLEYFGFDGETVWSNLGYESIFCVLFLVAAWAALQFRSFAKR